MMRRAAPATGLFVGQINPKRLSVSTSCLGLALPQLLRLQIREQRPSSSFRNLFKSPNVRIGGGARRLTILLNDSLPWRWASSAATASSSRFTFLLMHATCAQHGPLVNHPRRFSLLRPFPRVFGKEQESTEETRSLKGPCGQPEHQRARLFNYTRLERYFWMPAAARRASRTA
jgi:hypothetical protein